MFLHNRLGFMPIMFSGGPVGGGVPPATVPAPTATPPQPGAPGQGQGQGGQPNGFRQTFFANVDDPTWAAIEPHMSEVNRHVTQLQQRYAAFRDYTPEQVQGLARFASDFDKDPLGMWERLTRDLQSRGVIDQDLDTDYLAALARGEDPEAGQEVQGQLPPGQADEIPPWAQPLMQTVQQLQQSREQEQRQTQERRQDAALRQQLGAMREQLKAAGVPEEHLAEQRLLGILISHSGNVAAAVETEKNYRNATLSGFVKKNQVEEPQNLETPNGLPAAPSRPRGVPRDGFEGVRGSAEQFLRSAIKQQNQS